MALSRIQLQKTRIDNSHPSACPHVPRRRHPSTSSDFFGGKKQGDDESVETEDFGKDEDEDHSHEQLRLLSHAPDSGISDDSDGKSGSQAGQSDAETCTEVDEAPEEGNRFRDYEMFCFEIHLKTSNKE